MASKIRNFRFIDKELRDVSSELRAYYHKHFKKDYYLLKSGPGIGGTVAPKSHYKFSFIENSKASPYSLVSGSQISFLEVRDSFNLKVQHLASLNLNLPPNHRMLACCLFFIFYALINLPW